VETQTTQMILMGIPEPMDLRRTVPDGQRGGRRRGGRGDGRLGERRPREPREPEFAAVLAAKRTGQPGQLAVDPGDHVTGLR
jgi:hypothetical protein